MSSESCFLINTTKESSVGLPSDLEGYRYVEWERESLSEGVFIKELADTNRKYREECNKHAERKEQYEREFSASYIETGIPNRTGAIRENSEI